MTVAVSGDSITFPDNSVQATAPKVGMVNRIINGAMVIDQRNAGASVTITAASATQYVLDRFYLRAESAAGSKVSVQRSTVAPPGFTNSQLITSLSAYTIGASEHFATVQAVEGFNTADLAWGTASAQAITVSFWVRSSLTGLFGAFVLNNAANRCFVFSYTINAANTWEQKTVTIPGDTSGTWLTDNSIGLYLNFSVAAGSSVTGAAGSWSSTFNRSVTGQTSLVATSGATFYITGVQLEKGSTATSFDYRPYGTELVLCQRYYQKNYLQSVAVGASSGTDAQRSLVTPYAGSEYSNTIYLKQTMRTLATVNLWTTDGTANSWLALPAVVSRTTTAASISDNGFSVSAATTADGALQGMWAASAEL